MASAKTRKRKTQKGGVNLNRSYSNRRVTFSNNTKQTNNTNNYSQLPNTYLNELSNRIPQPSPVHGENAHMFAKVAATYNNPRKMAKDFYYMYYPSPLSTSDYTFLIELVEISGVSRNQKERILKHLRYERAIGKLQKTYNTSNKPTNQKNDMNVV